MNTTLALDVYIPFSRFNLKAAKYIRQSRRKRTSALQSLKIWGMILGFINKSVIKDRLTVLRQYVCKRMFACYQRILDAEYILDSLGYAY